MWVVPTFIAGLASGVTYTMREDDGNVKYVALFGTILLLLSLAISLFMQEGNMWSWGLIIIGVLIVSSSKYYAYTLEKATDLSGQVRSIEEWMLTPLDGEAIASKDTIVTKLNEPDLTPHERNQLMSQLDEMAYK